MSLESATVTDERLDALRSVFPEVFREGKVDFDALKRSLGETVESGPERFGLTWPGKAECARVIQTPSVGTLLPMKEESVDWDTTQNVIIEGENLEVLKLLQKAYYGKVKLIYIDPPYNTGKEFVYPDNFKEGLADYLRYSGQVDGEGLKVSANTDSDGRYHSKWLTMMYPRLFLARNLMRSDGLIFASIDDYEVHNLRAVMNEVFGEENFVGCFVRRRRMPTGLRDSALSPDHEYILCFARNAQEVTMNGFSLEETSFPLLDQKGSFASTDLTVGATKAQRPGQYYKIIDPVSGREYLPGERRVWRFEPARMAGEIESNNILWPDSEDRRPRYKTRFSSDRTAPVSTWIPSNKSEHDGERQDGVSRYSAPMNAAGSRDLAKLFPENSSLLEYPKPTKLLELLISIATNPGDLVLDFFAGSGTTGEASLNVGQRSFVLVQIPEALENNAFSDIAEFCRERVRRAVKGLKGQPPQLGVSPDCGFRSYRLSSSNFLVWDGTSKPAEQLQVGLGALAENVVAGRTQDDLAVELLLKLGFPMNTPMSTEVVFGKTVYSAADGAVMFFLDDRISIEIVEWMVAQNPPQIVVLEATFGGDDELKVNAVQTVKGKSSDKTVSGIKLLVV